MDPLNPWAMPSFDRMNPQPQVTPPGWPADGPASTTPVINPNTGNNLSRTETGPVLLQAFHLFLNQSNVIDWGKKAYAPGENGGISGIVFYAITRAEDDPRKAAGDAWEPGVPGVVVNLYQDEDGDGVADDLDGSGLVDANDAVNSVTTDSWDATPPTGCVQPLPIVHGQLSLPCADAYGTWNQIRPGVFDGGYAFTSYFTDPNGFVVPLSDPAAVNEVPLPAGNYVVEIVVPPGYKLVKEEDKNVEFGDEFAPSPLAIPCACVGEMRTVPQYLSYQTDDLGNPLPSIPAADLIPAPFAGDLRPLCDKRAVPLLDGQNAAADFFIFTDVPKAARVLGFALNDFTAEHNQLSPNFGEKLGAAWIPVSFKDWAGKEIVRVYTDEYGSYNAALPSTFSANIPSPSGYSPNMITLVLNDPFLADGTPDPFYNPVYSVTPWTFHYMPGNTSYLDTPLIPQSAFSAGGTLMDTNPPDGTPVIKTIDANPTVVGEQGPIFCSARRLQGATARTVTLTSMGNVMVPNPNYDPSAPGGAANPFLIMRNYGFGARGTQSRVTLNGQALTIATWSDAAVTVILPTNASITRTGRMMLRRANGVETEIGITLQVVDCNTTAVRYVNPGQSIQAQVDAAMRTDIIVVRPGTYRENVILNKPLRLLGSGAGGTIINADPSPLQKLQAWHDRITALGGTDLETFLLKKIFWMNEAPAIAVMGKHIYTGGNIMFPDANVMKIFNDDAVLPTGMTTNFFAGDVTAMIDGFTLSGSKAGGGIALFMAARGVTISNNNITGNSSSDAGGIAIGSSNLGYDQQTYDAVVSGNKIHKNSGLQGAGGIGVYEYSNNYRIENNLITGNFCLFFGGGVAHWGYIPGLGRIQNNKILFNEVHYNALLANAGDGGGIFIGGEVLGVEGSGSVLVQNNLIQANISGGGNGGGIRLFAINGMDVSANPNPSTWNQVRIVNNTIVNNVAALSGAGISMQDAARVQIQGNTIAHNDTTATAILAFTAGQLSSSPQPAGVVSSLHSDVLLGFLTAAGQPQTFSNPDMTSNVIWENRSFTFQVANGIGNLVLWNYWDLGVLESVTPTDPHLTPAAGNNIVTSRFDPKTGYDYGFRFTTLSPPFLAPYFNTLLTASVLDEGGNNISVLINPLVPTGNYAR